MTDYAKRIRWNMGQRELIGFDLRYLQSQVAHIDRCIEIETHNARAVAGSDEPHYPVDQWRHNLLFEAKANREFEIQQLELLLSEIELCYTWGLFDFQECR